MVGNVCANGENGGVRDIYVWLERWFLSPFGRGSGVTGCVLMLLAAVFGGICGFFGGGWGRRGGLCVRMTKTVAYGIYMCGSRGGF